MTHAVHAVVVLNCVCIVGRAAISIVSVYMIMRAMSDRRSKIPVPVPAKAGERVCFVLCAVSFMRVPSFVLSFLLRRPISAATCFLTYRSRAAYGAEDGAVRSSMSSMIVSRPLTGGRFSRAPSRSVRFPCSVISYTIFSRPPIGSPARTSPASFNLCK